MNNEGGVMEGTHCSLQLSEAITELCHISFYLPRGEVGGFSYKGTVTLDRFNKGFHHCYQVRAGSDATSLSLPPKEQPGDIFFKQTPTKDILTELYKLTVEKGRLLVSLLSSDHILGVAMGNQEGKLPELSVSLAPEDGCFQSAGDRQGEPPVGSLHKRSTHGNRKPRRSGGSRESVEVPPEKAARRRRHGGQEGAPQLGRGHIYSSNSFACSQSRPHLRLPEESGDVLPRKPLPSSLQRPESCPPGVPRRPDPDLGLGSSLTASEDAELGRGGSPPACGSTEPGRGRTQGLRRAPRQQARQQTGCSGSHKAREKQPRADRGGGEKSAEQTHRKKPASKVVAKVQDPCAQVQRVVRARPGGKGRTAVQQAAQAEFAPSADLLALPEAGAGAPGSQQGGKEQRGDQAWQSLAGECPGPPASTEGTVNKVLLKVIEREKFTEATEGTRLGSPRGTAATHTCPDTRSKRRAEPSPSGHKAWLLRVPPGSGPHRSQGPGGKKGPSPPALAALGEAFNNSSSEAGLDGRMSPVPSPPSPGLPSPEQHHRVLWLPGDRAATLDDSPAGKSGTSCEPPSADTSGPSSSAKVTETQGASWAFLRAGQPRPAPGEPSEKSSEPGKGAAQPPHPPPPVHSHDELLVHGNHRKRCLSH